ncbi:uncharacterized protein LOC119693120 [Plutella xylostella]|uniref:uncharacterized protein LOC119693120 n=1 Tax=Plutella xylostella TaxID=51655 RepID=UPI00203253CF|nr:uncharacterized protein LOC119693120 [Plutella xylostella]
MHYSLTFIIFTWICSYNYYKPVFGLPIDDGTSSGQANLLPSSETDSTDDIKPERRVDKIVREAEKAVDDYLYKKNFRWYNPGTWRFLDWVWCILIILLIVGVIVGSVILYRKFSE